MSFLTNVLGLLPKILPQTTQSADAVQQPSKSQADTGASQNPFDQDQFQDLVRQLLGQGEDSFVGPSPQQTGDASAQVGSQLGAQAAAAAAQAPQAAAPAEAAAPANGVTPSGNGPGADRIRRTIDRLDPQHNPTYQPRGVPGTAGRETYCNYFARDFMRQVGVPRQNAPQGTANNMNHWLNNQGQQHGWHQVSAAEAQRAANNGQVVLASQTGARHGHVAVVRPGSENGVHIAQAGGHNYNDAPVSRGFGRRQPQYFVYDGPTSGGQRRAPPSSTGPSTPAPSADAPQTQAPQTQSPQVQGPASTNGRQPLNLHDQFSSPDSTLSVAIGNAEGNRTVNGGRTRSYNGHSDPGNHAHNMGTFSYQARQNANVHTPEQADQAQLARLRGQIPRYEAAARQAGLDPNNPRLQAAYFDLYNQSPRMAGRFLQRMGSQLGGRELNTENIARARANAAFDDNGRFTSTGLHNPQRAYQDQLRRERALESVLQARGAV